MKTLILRICCFCFVGEMASAADVWSNCVNVTSVSEYRAYDSTVYFGTEPRIGQCVYGGINRVRIVSGSTEESTVKSIVALATIAHVADKKVQFYYTEGATCDVKIIALSGYNGQCK